MEQDKDFSLEEAFKRLEQIASALEEGNLSLMEALEKYEAGMKLAGVCEQHLNAMVLKVDQVVKRKEEMFLQPVFWEENEV